MKLVVRFIGEGQWWARMVTGNVFILIGIWFSLAYVIELR